MPNYEEVRDHKQKDGEGPYDNQPITKWREKGQVAEGILKAKRTGKYGPLYDIGGGTYPGATVLNGKMALLNIGDQVRIEYLGKFRSGTSGAEYQNFTVHVAKTGPKAGPVPPTTGVGDDLSFDLLLSRIRAQRGDGVANALKAATTMSNDPFQALKKLAQQVGIESEDVPF